MATLNLKMETQAVKPHRTQAKPWAHLYKILKHQKGKCTKAIRSRRTDAASKTQLNQKRRCQAR